MTGRDDPRHNLRLTPDLKTRLAHSAIDNGRSMNAEILARLERSFTPDPATLLADAFRPLQHLDEDQQKRVVDHLVGLANTLAATRVETENNSED